MLLFALRQLLRAMKAKSVDGLVPVPAHTRIKTVGDANAFEVSVEIQTPIPARRYRCRSHVGGGAVQQPGIRRLVRDGIRRALRELGYFDFDRRCVADPEAEQEHHRPRQRRRRILGQLRRRQPQFQARAGQHRRQGHQRARGQLQGRRLLRPRHLFLRLHRQGQRPAAHRAERVLAQPQRRRRRPAGRHVLVPVRHRRHAGRVSHRRARGRSAT